MLQRRVPTLWSRRLGMRSQDQTQFCSCGFLWPLWPAFLGTVQLLTQPCVILLDHSQWRGNGQEGRLCEDPTEALKLPFMGKTWRPGGTFFRCDGHEGRKIWAWPYYKARDTGNSASNSAHILASVKAMTSLPTKAWKQLFLIIRHKLQQKTQFPFKHFNMYVRVWCHHSHLDSFQQNNALELLWDPYNEPKWP